MLQHVFGKRDNINIINLDHTLSALRRAINVVRGVAHDDGNILFVGTRLQSQRLAIKSALNSDCFYVTKWIGGMITNKDRVLARLGQTDQNKISEINALTVKEDLTGEAEILQKDSGIELPDLIILLDYKSNLWAIREANLKKIPIIALIDTDCDPRLVQYPIPGNDDAVSSVELFAGLMSLAAKEGREMKRESERKV